MRNNKLDTRSIHRWAVIVLLLSAVSIGSVAVRAQVPQDRDGLMAGEGMGQGLTADINGYPGPQHILDLAKDLQLTDAQRKSVQGIFDEMKTRAKELGRRIIGVEGELNEAFKSGLISEKSILDDAEQIGKLRGRLRAVHLAAHLKAKGILTAAQLETYRKLRTADAEKKH